MHFVIYIFVLCYVSRTEIDAKINLALHKTTESSKPYYSVKDSSKAVDGVIGSNDNSCFYAGAKDGWIAVDLGKMFRIQTVIVHGRLDANGGYLKGLVVRLTPTMDDKRVETLKTYEECNTYNTDVSDGQKVVFQCKNQISEYRYVVLGPHFKGYFHICEVEVYERELKSFGCFENVVPLASFHTVENSTLSSCFHTCRGMSATFAALKDGNTCDCADRVGKRMISSCSLQCVDNPSFPCGGFEAYSIYAVCSPGYYGTSCDEVCHCREGTSCNAFGICFDRCQDGWKESRCDEIDGNYTNDYHPIGCFDKIKSMNRNGLQTKQKCAKFCNSYDFKYFGLDGYFCNCYDEINHLQRREDNCYSNMNLFTVCRPGSYGEFCLKSCHCSSGVCFKDNGTCQQMGGCLPGWKGSDCNIRDCSVNNGACNEHSKCLDDDGYDNDPVCHCEDGYNDLQLCGDEDECAMGTFRCWNNSKCNNIDGSYKCECFNGFEFEPSSSSCEDINECRLEICDSPSTGCRNTIGSFQCNCKIGFKLGSKTTLCHDIDECDALDLGGCDPVTTNCSNTVGSFECICKDKLLVLNDTFKFCQVQVHSFNFGNWQLPLIISVVVLVVVLIILLGIILIMQHLKKLRKRLSNFSNKDKDDSLLKSYDVNTIPVENLEKYFRYHIADIHKQFLTAPKQTNKDCKYGANVEVRDKNRFKNVIPYDFNRVILKNSNKASDYSNYINASYISQDGTGHNGRFIACQGPTDNSVEDFLSMLIQENVDAIVMLTMVYEEGREKCTQYWPEPNKVFECGKITVSIESTEKWAHFIMRNLNIMNKKSGETAKVAHYLYTSWPDKGVPNHLESLLHLRRKVILRARHKIAVHCSAGIGRTGTFLAIHFLLNQADINGSVNVVQCINNLRAQRAQMIQNTKQYELCYLAVILHHKIGDTSIPAGNLGSFRQRLLELNKEVEGVGNLINRQFRAIQELTGALEPSCSCAFLSVLQNSTWYGHHFPGLRRTSAFVAGVVMGNFNTAGLVGILSQPGSIALCFDDPNSANVTDSLLPSEGKKMSVEENSLNLKRVDKFDDIKKFTYELTPTNAANNIYSNMTTSSREFSIIKVPHNFMTNSQVITKIWKVTNNSQTDGENQVFLLGDNYSDIGTFMAAVNIFEMIDVHAEADIFQVALSLMLIFPEVLEPVSFSILHGLAEQYVAVKKENTIKMITSDITVRARSSSVRGQI